jgi:hypothetical protein
MEEKVMILEDKILAYLDGSLSESESSELLERLALSPEKRTILEEHLRMRDVLALGRKPFEVPQATEQMLVAQLPAITNIGTYAGSSVFSMAWNAVTSWVATHVVTAVASGTAIAVVGAVMLNANVLSHGTAKVDEVVSKGGNSASGVVSEQGSVSMASGLNRSNGTYASHRTYKTNKNDQPISSESVAAAEPTPQQNEEQSAQLSTANPRSLGVAIPGQSVARTLSELANPPVEGYHPVTFGANGLVSMIYLPTVDRGDGMVQNITTRHVYPELTFDYDLSPSFAVGLEAGASLIANLESYPQPPTVIKSPDDKLAQLPGYSSKVYTTEVNDLSLWSLRLSSHYTFNEASSLPIRLGLSGGATVDGYPIGTASLGISRVISSSLIFDLAGVFTMARGTFTNASLDSVGSTTGIHTQAASTKPYTSAFGLRAGFRYRP